MAVTPLKTIAETNPDAWLDAFLKSVGRTDPQVTKVQNTSAGSAAAIEQLVASLTGQATSGEFSKGAAMQDSDAMLAQIFSDFKNQALPQIFQQQAGSGGYNSSTAQLMSNDAFARTVAAGQAGKAKMITDYAGIQANQATNAVNAAQVSKNVNPTTTQQVKPGAVSTVGQYGSLVSKLAPQALSRSGITGKVKSLVWDAQRGGPMEAYDSLVSPASSATSSMFGSGGGIQSFGNNPMGSMTNFGSVGDVGGSGIDFSSMVMNATADSSNFASSFMDSFRSSDFSSAADSVAGVGAAEDPVYTYIGSRGGTYGSSYNEQGQEIDASYANPEYNYSDQFGNDYWTNESGIIQTATGPNFIDSASQLTSDFWGSADQFGGAAGSFAGGLDSASQLTADFWGGADQFGAIGEFAGVGDFAGGVPLLGIGMSLAQGNFGSAIGTGIGYAIGGPVGGFIGGAIGGGSVICTELNRQGLLSNELYMADSYHAATKLSLITVRGYRFWAIPVVSLMRKSPKLSKFTLWFAKNRAESLIRRNWKGSIIRLIFEPICFLIGLVVKEPDFNLLYQHG